ncbi:MAG: DinB family protein [Chloroflexi bacterium]|nr:DinB family protein [Chloroflexota bacterium]
MKELIDYREKLVKRFREVALEFRAACEAVGDPSSKVEGEWTLHQIASHTRDVQKLVYNARIEQTLLVDDPLFDGFDADEWMAAHYNPREPLAGILNELTQNVDELCVVLSGVTREAWSRESRHPELGGGLTLQFWVERSLGHIKEHLTAVKRLNVK